jgi:tight adherence protein B
MIDVLIRVAALLAIFVSVFLFAQLGMAAINRNRSHLAAINKRLQMIREGRNREEIMAQLRKNAPSTFPNLPPFIGHRLQAFQRMLMASGIPLTPTQLMVGMAGVFMILLAILLLGLRAVAFGFGSGSILLVLVIAFCAAGVIPSLIISGIAQRRRKRIEQQFPIAVDVFVRALRSGHPIAAAIDLLTREMEDPIGSEFGLVADEVSYGADLRDALAGMADRWDLGDMRMFVVCLSVQNETGGNLAEILQNLAEVIRARAAMYMKVRALSSEGRMTGWMLTVLPIITFVGLFTVNPRFYLDVAQDSMFITGFIILISLYVIGVVTIRRMIDLKV